MYPYIPNTSTLNLKALLKTKAQEIKHEFGRTIEPPMTELEDKMPQAINDCPNSIGCCCEIMESSKVCAKIAVEEQISLLEGLRERLQSQWDKLDSISKGRSGSSADRLSGKKEGVMIAIENIRQEVADLKSQL